MLFRTDIRRFDQPSISQTSYDQWVAQFDTLTAADRDAIRTHIVTFETSPKISIIVPVYNTDEDVLVATLASVTRQLYGNWELCIADDCSTAEHVGPVLERFARSDGRIKVARRTANGHIAAASNSALALATGEFIGLLDHDDLLSETALYEVALECLDHPDVDILFSDEDKVDGSGRRFDPYFKPDFSLDLTLGQNVVNHFSVFRKTLVDDIGGFRSGFDGSQDYDVVLRALAKTSKDRIRHIPAILYHWRQTSEGNSFSRTSLDRCVEAADRALREALATGLWGRTGTPVPISRQVPWHRIRTVVPHPEPLVSIIIPTRDRAKLLQTCIEGLLHRTDYRAIEIIVVDNGSAEDSTFALFDTLKSDARVRILKIDGEFNYSALNNAAADHARGEFLLLLNNDIDVIRPEWLAEMIGLFGQADVGIVGAKLLFADSRVQHAGVRLGAGTFDGGPGVAGHLGLFQRRHDLGYFGLLALTRDVGAVTGACLAIRRSLYRALGGLDEVNLKVAFNDIDLCLKARKSGFRVVWTPFAELFHLESASRGPDTARDKIARFHAECRTMLDRWGDTLQNDPFYNPAFDNHQSDFILCFPPRRPKPWRDFMGQQASP